MLLHASGHGAVLDTRALAAVKIGPDKVTAVVRSKFARPDQLDASVRLGILPSFPPPWRCSQDAKAVPVRRR